MSQQLRPHHKPQSRQQLSGFPPPRPLGAARPTPPGARPAECARELRANPGATLRTTTLARSIVLAAASASSAVTTTPAHAHATPPAHSAGLLIQPTAAPLLATGLSPFATLPGRHRADPAPTPPTATVLPLTLPADVVARPVARAARSATRTQRPVVAPVARVAAVARRSAVVAPVVAVAAYGRAAEVVAFAWAQIGKPYVMNAAGPNSFDCSGLVLAAYLHVGIRLPHNAAAFYGVGRAVGRDQLQPGDIILMDNGGHAGIYVGNGMMVHAPHSGDHVRVAPIWHFSGARRLA